MGRSLKYTAKKYFDEARLDIHDKTDDSIWVDRFRLINRSQDWVQSNFGELVAPSFMTYATLLSDNVAKFFSSSASWDATNNYLTVTMTVNFASTDTGKTIVFGDGTNAYMGTISVVADIDVVQISGSSLPLTNIATVTSVTVLSTKFVSGSTINIANLPILRYGENVKMSLQSASTKAVNLVPLDEFNRFESSSPQNKNTIVYCIIGNEIRLSAGSSLTNIGTLTLNYPEIVHDVHLDTENIDLLDGAMVQLGIIVCRQFIMRRMGANLPQETIENAINTLYKSYGQSAVNEVLSEKSKILIAGS